jgi:hypothetical protein
MMIVLMLPPMMMMIIIIEVITIREKDIIKVVKSVRIMWSGYVARQGERRMDIAFYLESLMKREHMANLGVDGRIILK